MGDFPVGDFHDVWTYPFGVEFDDNVSVISSTNNYLWGVFARGVRKSEGDQHKKAAGLIVDLSWVATGCVSSGLLSNNIGSRADPRDDGPGRLLSSDDFWGESGMTITSVDELVVVCMSVGFPPVNFPLVVFFWGLALVDFWGGDDFPFLTKICQFSKVTVWFEESTIASLSGSIYDYPIH